MSPLWPVRYKHYLYALYKDATRVPDHYEPSRATRMQSVRRGNTRMKATRQASALFDRLTRKETR